MNKETSLEILKKMEDAEGCYSDVHRFFDAEVPHRSWLAGGDYAHLESCRTYVQEFIKEIRDFADAIESMMPEAQQLTETFQQSFSEEHYLTEEDQISLAKIIEEAELQIQKEQLCACKNCQRLRFQQNQQKTPDAYEAEAQPGVLQSEL